MIIVVSEVKVKVKAKRAEETYARQVGDGGVISLVLVLIPLEFSHEQLVLLL